MSLQPEAIAYHTDANGSSYFFGSGGGGGVTGLLGTGAGSIPTTAAEPDLDGEGGITCTSIAGGVTIAPADVQYYAGPTAEQTLTNGGGDLSFSIPLSTVLNGTYAVTALVSFKSTTLVFPAVSIATITTLTMDLTNTSGGVAGRFVQQSFPVGLFNLAALSPSELPISLSGVITNTVADTLSVYVSAETPPPVGQTITVFVSAVTIQRLS